MKNPNSENIQNLLERYREMGFENFDEVNLHNEEIIDNIINLHKNGKLIDSYKKYKLTKKDLETPINMNKKQNVFQKEEIEITLQMEKFLMLLEQAIEMSVEKITEEDKKNKYLSKEDKSSKRQIDKRISSEYEKNLNIFIQSDITENMKILEINKSFEKIRNFGSFYIHDSNNKFNYQDLNKAIKNKRIEIKNIIKQELQMGRLEHYDIQQVKDMVLFLVEGDINDKLWIHFKSFKKTTKKTKPLDFVDFNNKFLSNYIHKKQSNFIEHTDKKIKMKEVALEKYEKSIFLKIDIDMALTSWSNRIKQQYRNQNSNKKRGKYHLK